MRKNKKLLLASVAAMGALALGVGATSTFAWYSSTLASSVSKGTDTQTLSVTKATADDQPVHINVTIATDTAPELTDSAGETWYVVNGNKYKHTSNSGVGVYRVTVAWADGDQTKWAAAGAAGTLDLTITAKAQVSTNVYAKLLVSGASNAADGDEDANIAESATMRVIIAANGGLSFKTDGNYTNCTPSASYVTGKFALRPGQEGTTPDDYVASYSNLLTVA